MADIEQVVEEVLKQVGVKCFKDEQRMILDCMFEKKDCVAVLPTGFGKSLPFQAYLPVKRALLRDDSSGKVIVCCPLVSLMGGLEADKEDKVFRKWFRLVGEIRSYFPEASLFALNMTCTKTIKNRVIKVLGLKDYTNITVSGNKENIKYIVKKVDPNIEISLLWILDSIRDLKKEFPRTLFYCISIRDVGCVYNFIVSELSDVTNIENMVEMFHSETTGN
ncbi:uncharacterized protein LOC125667544 [Ostrea edulis]|uniref:uncharacterized protein LOC125667544 n=1 Tax=Ostrea edulis TaxID=37623 RepID=UPI0024AFF764|nr:uncharacterized protein LOC125667544 [Ostrea edulis]